MTPLGSGLRSSGFRGVRTLLLQRRAPMEGPSCCVGILGICRQRWGLHKTSRPPLWGEVSKQNALNHKPEA